MVILRKNILRKKCLQKRTQANHEQYRQTRKEANKICKEKKKQWINNRIKQVEAAHKRKDILLPSFSFLTSGFKVVARCSSAYTTISSPGY
jgi:hypothetical protein